MNKINSRIGSQLIFAQLFGLIDQLSDAQYAEELVMFNGSSIGKHCRHILDFYRCVVNGADRSILDYCKRDRSPSIENNIDFAKSAFLELQGEIDSLKEDQIIDVYTEFHLPENTERPIVESTIGRELMYAYDHAVHHLAIIKIGVQSAFCEVEIDQNIGVASSTLSYESNKD